MLPGADPNVQWEYCDVCNGTGFDDSTVPGTGATTTKVAKYHRVSRRHFL